MKANCENLVMKTECSSTIYANLLMRICYNNNYNAYIALNINTLKDGQLNILPSFQKAHILLMNNIMKIPMKQIYFCKQVINDIDNVKTVHL